MRDDTGLSSSEVILNIAGEDVDLVNTEEGSRASSSKMLGLRRRSIHLLTTIAIVLMTANDETGTVTANVITGKETIKDPYIKSNVYSSSDFCVTKLLNNSGY